MPKINDETLFDVVAVFIAADAIHSRWLWQVLLQNYDLLVKYICQGLISAPIQLPLFAKNNNNQHMSGIG